MPKQCTMCKQNIANMSICDKIAYCFRCLCEKHIN